VQDGAGRERREKREKGRRRSGGILGGGGRCIGKMKSPRLCQGCCRLLELEVQLPRLACRFGTGYQKLQQPNF